MLYSETFDVSFSAICSLAAEIILPDLPMTSGNPAIAALLEDIRSLKPGRVLDVGGTLVDLLREQGLAADAGTPDAQRSGEPYDLVVVVDPPVELAAAGSYVALGSAVMLCVPEAAIPVWLETLFACGFRPELSWERESVLLRRSGGPPREAALWAEFLRLRTRVGRVEQLEQQVISLESSVRRLRRQVDGVVGSRIWRVLTRIGGLFLAARDWRRPASVETGSCTTKAYRRWIVECEDNDLPLPPDGPRFSVLLPDDAAETTVASLSAQSYTLWEIASETALPSCECLLWPGSGDELAPGALAAFARAFRGGADLVYCDEDALDAGGNRTDPLFKPDWSPDLLLSQNYIGRAVAFRRDLVESAGGISTDGLYGLLLRMSRRTSRIVHIPRVLYHRRTERPAACRGAIEDYLRAAAVKARIEEGRAPGSWRVRYAIPAGMHVEIVVPSRNRTLLERCLASVVSKTGYPHYSFAVIDNSDSGELAGTARKHGARYVDWTKRPFNYSAMNNAAALGCSAPLMLFLNDDTTVIDPDWLGAMVELAARPEVGAVGGRLLYPDGRLQHAGVVIGIFGVCGHAFKRFSGEGRSYFNLADVIRNVSAVTGACLMLRSKVFHDVGGFDETYFPVAYNDIDLCLRIMRAGYRVLYTPHASLMHHEAFSKPARHRDPSLPEIRAFQTRWRDFIDHDPFYNPNLSRRDENYSLGGAWER